MFDIVSKNKKLSFLVSFINDNISPTTNKICKQFLDIQNDSPFIQTRISTHIHKLKPSLFEFFEKRDNKTKSSSYSTTSNHRHTNNRHTNNRHTSNHATNHTSSYTNKDTLTKEQLKFKHMFTTTEPSQKKSETKTDIHFPNKVFHVIQENKIMLHVNGSYDFLVAGFLMCIDSNFIQTKYHLQLEYIKTLKYKMALELDTHNLYKEFLYNKVRSLKKTVLQTSLFNNKDIHYQHLYRYLGDYFDVNFIGIIDSIFIQYYNEFKDKRMNIVIYKDKDEYFIDTSSNSDEFMYNNTMDISQFIKYPGQTFKEFDKLKLTIIQTIAKRKNISIKQLSNKNKTKKMLIEEILQ